VTGDTDVENTTAERCGRDTKKISAEIFLIEGKEGKKAAERDSIRIVGDDLRASLGEKYILSKRL
jgi:hypothetical protein